MNYDKLYSRSLPAPVDMPSGALAQTKYVFSVTYTDPDTMPSDGLAKAIREGPGT